MMRLFRQGIGRWMLAVLMALWAGCTADEMTADGEVTLTLQLSLPGSEEGTDTRAISASTESILDISQVKVLVFMVSGSKEVFAYEAPQVKLVGGKYTATLRQSTKGESYRLVIIANAGTKLPFIAEGTEKTAALKLITFSCSGAWKANSDSDYSPIPMWGEAGSAKVISAAMTESVTLLRALARIDVGCQLSGETATGLSNFQLKTVSVYRTRNKGYVAPVNGGTITNNVVASVSVPTDAGVNSKVTYNCTDNKSVVRSIYVAETEQGSNRNNNVCLVIGGTYNGSTNYYRVDLKSGNSYIPLKRNCRYVVSIKSVSNAGYTTEALALNGDKTVIIATSVSSGTWANEVTTGSGTIILQ